MRVELSPKQTIAWDYLEDQQTNEVFFGGAAGGGKSWFGCLWHISRRTRYPNTRGLIGRAKLSTLKQSTMITFFDVASKMGYKANVHFKYNAQDHIVTWGNGSVTIFKDLFQYPSDPDFTSLGSTEYTDVFIDEVTEITLKAYDIVNSRIRYKLMDYGLTPKTLSTGNPRKNWVKDKFVDNHLPPTSKFIQSLLSDNPSAEFKASYKSQLEKMSSEYDKRRLLYGDWEVDEKALNPFAHKFDPDLHIKNVDFQPDKQLLISIDFNIQPFCANFFHSWADGAGQHFHIFDEISIENGNVPLMAEKIVERYGPYLYNARLTGDKGGDRGDISQRDLASHYTQLKRLLRLGNGQIVTPANPKHKNSRADVNYVLTYLPDFAVSPKCKGTIYDLRMVEVDEGEKIIKSDRTRQSQQSDFLDCVRYGVNTFLFRWIQYHQKANPVRR